MELVIVVVTETVEVGWRRSVPVAVETGIAETKNMDEEDEDEVEEIAAAL